MGPTLPSSVPTRRLHSFLPAHLIRKLAETGTPPTGRVDDFVAALLLCDIEGFTSLTERLSERGREGAEEIGRLIDGAFRPVIRAASEAGGSIVSFGGDSIFVVFEGDRGVGRAVRAAEAIADSFARRAEMRTSVGEVQLRIRQVIHHGKVRGVHVGRARRRRYLMVGQAVGHLARLESETEPGRIRLSRAAKAALGGATMAKPKSRVRSPVRGRAWKQYLPPWLEGALEGFEGEFRKVAVLFLQSRGWAPDFHQKLAPRVEDVLERFGGILLETDVSEAGTKWLCVFGVPTSHEDDAERGARAGLDIAGDDVRGCVATGVAANLLIGTGVRSNFSVMGDVVNTAARGAAEAAWGQILVTDRVQKALAHFTFTGRISRRVKGKREPLVLHGLDAGSSVPRVAVASPLVGRDREMARLVDALVAAEEGSGSAIGLRAQAGLGKSRLRWELVRRARDRGFVCHVGGCKAYGQVSMQPLVDLIRGALELSPDAGSSEVGEVVTRLPMPAADARHLEQLLAGRVPSHLANLDARAKRLNDHLALEQAVHCLQADAPRVLVLEDLHWADEATSACARFLASRLGERRVLLLMLYRPGAAAPAGIEELELDEIPEDAIDEMLASLLGSPPREILEPVRRRAGGNPLYIEEVVRHFAESGVLVPTDEGYRVRGSLSAATIPDRLESLIAARLDRLPPRARRVGQMASVVGVRFSEKLLHRVASEEDTAEGLRTLQDREIVVSRGNGGGFAFKHALTRDVAYGTILTATRRKLHRQLARALASEEGNLGTLGYHWENSGASARARECYRRAGAEAFRRRDHEEAERLYRACLRLSDPTKPATWRVEMALAAVLDSGSRLAEALELRTGILERQIDAGNLRAEASCRRSMGIALRHLGRWDESLRHLERARRIHRELGGRRAEVQSMVNLANLFMDRGQMVECEALLTEALREARRLRHTPLQGLIRANMGSLYGFLGRLEEARVHLEEGLALARRNGDRSSEANCLQNLATLRYWLGDRGGARQAYEEALAVFREFSDRISTGFALINLADICSEEGETVRARAMYEEAIETQRAVGDAKSLCLSLGDLAKLERRVGRYERAVRLLDEAEELSSRTGHVLALGHCFSQRGHLLLAQGAAAEVQLMELSRIAEKTQAGEDSELGHTLARLKRAIDALERGESLLHGEWREDLPEALHPKPV